MIWKFIRKEWIKDLNNNGIPADIKEFVKEYKETYNMKSATDVVIYAIRMLKKKVEKENGFFKTAELEFIDSPYEKKLNDPYFGKREYDIVKKLKLEEIQDYEAIKLKKPGYTLFEYCNEKGLDWTER